MNKSELKRYLSYCYLSSIQPRLERNVISLKQIAHTLKTLCNAHLCTEQN